MCGIGNNDCNGDTSRVIEEVGDIYARLNAIAGALMIIAAALVARILYFKVKDREIYEIQGPQRNLRSFNEISVEYSRRREISANNLSAIHNSNVPVSGLFGDCSSLDLSQPSIINSDE